VQVDQPFCKNSGIFYLIIYHIYSIVSKIYNLEIYTKFQIKPNFETDENGKRCHKKQNCILHNYIYNYIYIYMHINS